MPKKIEFYSPRNEYGEFSNFFRQGFHLDGKFWPTSEHYYQAQKFAGTEHEDFIRQLKTPREAADAGRDPERPLRADWELVKVAVMKTGVLAKFQSYGLRDRLLATGDAELVEGSNSDFYWGRGADGTGLNMLGKVLMEVREELKHEALVCLGRFRVHSWSGWCAYDEHVFDGTFRYHRECNLMGCKAKERVEDLVPTGKMESFE